MNLGEKIKKARQIIKRTAKRYSPVKLAVAWTGGKDSTTLLHLIKEVFGKIPFPVFFNDSTMEFDEVYEFIDRIKDEWTIQLIKVKHLPKELAEFHKTKSIKRKKELSRTMKISSIRFALKKYNWQAFMSAIRWDEHQSRSKEKFFSPRKDHERIHPLLHFTEKNVWEYIRKFKVPYVSLYDKGYRSLGEAPFTKPAKKGGGERSGRDYDKERVMQRLRSLGYW